MSEGRARHRAPARTSGRRDSGRPRSGVPDPARTLAFTVLRQVTGDGAFPNIVLAQALRDQRLPSRDAALVTELVNGTCRFHGTYDRILEAASGRSLTTLQPAVIDVLRLGCHQLLSLRTPAHAAVTASVDLARQRIGERVTGLVNAVLRQVLRQDIDAWTAELSAGEDEFTALATRTHHPAWIVAAYADRLPAGQLEAALAANNVPALPTLVARPGLADRADLVAAGATPCEYSPFGARIAGAPGDLTAVRDGRVGVQDEGSQLVALALSRAVTETGPWLDVCAGPGGKASLLHGLARERDTWLLAAEKAPHRARLVAQAMSAYGQPPPVICADGTRPAWTPSSFAAVLADVPCTGLGALRRRPESRWRRDASSLAELVPLQRALLSSAVAAAAPGGVVAYVTCSPHPDETVAVVEEFVAAQPDVDVLPAAAYLPEVPAAGEKFIQLWPHLHGTDAMFCALLRKGVPTARVES